MRLTGLDVFRGYAIVLMVAFHFCFDLNNFHIVNFNLSHGEFWKYFRYLIVTMFVFTAGISFKLAHKEKIEFKKVQKRVLTLAIASALVSVGSYTQFANSWIYFGILHFFLFASIIGLAFLKVPKLSLLVGVAIIIGYNYGGLNMHWLFELLQAPLHLPISHTEDLATIFPWFGVFLLGLSFADFGLERVAFKNKFFSSTNKINGMFAYLGKHSLIVYMIHQPILFGMFFASKNVLW